MPSLAYTWAIWALAVPSETSSASRKYEVLGIDGEPIPHLYSAGELGDIAYDPKTKRHTCAIEQAWRSTRLAGPLLHGGFDIHRPTESIYTHPCPCRASNGVDLFRLSAYNVR